MAKPFDITPANRFGIRNKAKPNANEQRTTNNFSQREQTTNNH